MPSVSVCLSPRLLGEFDLNNKIVVVTDIFRATSCMVTAVYHGVSDLRAFKEESACRAMRDKGYLLAGERNGIKLKEFDLGNSPLGYIEYDIKERKVAMTTTNGTLSLEAASKASQVLVGAFLNISKTVEYLSSQSKDVVVLCAAWKGRVNLEDSGYAGALVRKLTNYEHWELEGDEAKLSLLINQSVKGNATYIEEEARHGDRLRSMGFQKDLTYCLTHDLCDVVIEFDPKLNRIKELKE